MKLLSLLLRTIEAFLFLDVCILHLGLDYALNTLETYMTCTVYTKNQRTKIRKDISCSIQLPVLNLKAKVKTSS